MLISFQGNCLYKLDELERENKKLTEELIQLNEEVLFSFFHVQFLNDFFQNRNLLQSLDDQNSKVHHNAKVSPRLFLTTIFLKIL